MWPDMARLFLIWQPKFRGRRENICYFILFVLGVSGNGFESWAQVLLCLLKGRLLNLFSFLVYKCHISMFRFFFQSIASRVPCAVCGKFKFLNNQSDHRTFGCNLQRIDGRVDRTQNNVLFTIASVIFCFSFIIGFCQ